MKNILIFIILISLFNCSTKKHAVEVKSKPLISKDSLGEIVYISKIEKGALDNELFEKFKQYLVNISNEKIDFSKSTVINLMNNKPEVYSIKSPLEIFKGNLSKDLNRIEYCNLFWIKNSKITNKYDYHLHGNKLKWRVDKDSFLKNIFFKNNNIWGGFIIIKPNGDYYLNRSSYTKSEILRVYKTFANNV